MNHEEWFQKRLNHGDVIGMEKEKDDYTVMTVDLKTF
jgi:hypothetical protein